MWYDGEIAPVDAKIEAAQADSGGNSPTEMHDPDDCCGRHLEKALRKGIAGETWNCPKCGELWRARLLTESNIRHWKPEPLIEVIRRC